MIINDLKLKSKSIIKKNANIFQNSKIKSCVDYHDNNSSLISPRYIKQNNQLNGLLEKSPKQKFCKNDQRGKYKKII